LAVHAYDNRIFFDDDPSYNPCNTVPGKLYYPSPTDIHKFYQCDASGQAYAQSCGNLVWDDSILTCNWASAVVVPVTTTTTTTSRIPWTPPPEQSSSTSTGPVFSFCDPNPCGAHGQCLLTSTPSKYVCVCSGNWFGQLCDQNLGGVVTTTTTTPSGPTIQIKAMSQPMYNLPSFWWKQNKNLKDMLYGSRVIDIKREVNGRPKRTIVDSSLNEKFEQKSSTEEPNSANVESTTRIMADS